MHKYEFMDWMVYNIQLTWKLAWMLKTYRTCNSTVRFSKYELYNKLLGDVTLLKVTLGVSWAQPNSLSLSLSLSLYIYIYIYIQEPCNYPNVIAFII